MNKLKVVLYDHMEEYVSAMVHYLSENFDNETQTAGFSQREALFTYCRQESPDILLVEESLFEEELEELHAGQIILLTDDEVVEGAGRFPTIMKYQPADDVVRRIFSCYEPSEDALAQSFASGKTKLISVYSPGQLKEQTPFAATLAMSLKRDYNVLYINIRENAGFEQIFERQYPKDLSDLIYLSNHKHESFRSLLAGMVYENQDLVYLPPMENPIDAMNLSKEEWMRFLNSLVSDSGYDYAVLDLSGIIPVFYEILMMSHKIYVPVETHPYGRAQLTQFEQRLKHKGLSELKEKMNRIRLSSVQGLFASQDVLTDWIWGDLGDYARSLVAREAS